MKGDRLRGEMLGAAGADWLIVTPEGTGTVDVRMALQTDDGAVIFVQYNGRMDLSRGFQFPMTAYVAPRFETGDERYVAQPHPGGRQGNPLRGSFARLRVVRGPLAALCKPAIGVGSVAGQPLTLLRSSRNPSRHSTVSRLSGACRYGRRREG